MRRLESYGSAAEKPAAIAMYHKSRAELRRNATGASRESATGLAILALKAAGESVADEELLKWWWCRIINGLLIRGQALACELDRTATLADLRAAFAMLRQMDVNLDDPPASLALPPYELDYKPHLREFFLEALAVSKATSPRPHFDARAIDDLRRELQIDHYSARSLLCGACGARPSRNGISLKLCAGCQQTWFCSRRCQRSAWKLHKPQCGAGRRSCDPVASAILVVPLGEKEVADEIIRLRGAVTLAGPDGPMAILRDPKDPDVYFDSLSDRTVKWLPDAPIQIAWPGASWY